MMLKKIPEKEVEKIPIEENNESLVKIRFVCPDIMINNLSSTPRVREESRYLRKTVAEKLCNVQKKLKEIKPNCSLMVSWGFRSLDTQRRGYNHFYEKFKEENPSLTEEEIKEMTSDFIAHPEEETPPHTTGAVIDLTITCKDNSSGKKYKELDMGTEIHSRKKESVTFSENISEKQKKNREFLIHLMKEEGFVNYPIEWWHWSYKDKYWAAEKGQGYSEYGPVNDLTKEKNKHINTN